jgi:colicin import membrane protein
MKRSVSLSVGLHAGVLVLALFSLPSSDALKAPPVNSIEVDISQITDQSKRMAATTEDVPKTEKVAPKKMEVVKETPPAPKISDEVNTAAKEPVAPDLPKPPEPKKEEPKKEEPRKEEPKKAEEKPLDPDPLKQLIAAQEAEVAKKEAEAKKQAEEKKKADEKKKAEEKKKADEKKKAEEKKKIAEKKKKDLKLDDIAEFLNKKDGERTTQVKQVEEGAPKKAEKAMAGADDAIAATLLEALVSKVKQCFVVPPAARDTDISVRVRFQLDQDGNVASVKAESQSDPIGNATAAAAVSAIKGCEPYDLPPDKYDLWKDVILDFNPNMLFRT